MRQAATKRRRAAGAGRVRGRVRVHRSNPRTLGRRHVIAANPGIVKRFLGGASGKVKAPKRSDWPIGKALDEAYKAGRHYGDTGAFEDWLEKTGLMGRGSLLHSRLEREFRRAVEGEPERTVSYKGVTISLLPDGEWSVSIEPESRFDGLTEAKQFVDATLKGVRRNPSPTPETLKRFPHGELFRLGSKYYYGWWSNTGLHGKALFEGESFLDWDRTAYSRVGTVTVLTVPPNYQEFMVHDEEALPIVYRKPEKPSAAPRIKKLDSYHGYYYKRLKGPWGAKYWASRDPAHLASEEVARDNAEFDRNSLDDLKKLIDEYGTVENPLDLATIVGVGVLAGAVQGVVEPYVTKHVYGVGTKPVGDDFKPGGKYYKERKGNPKPVASMQVAEFNHTLDKLEAEQSRLIDEMIEAGRGNERPSEYLKMTDPLSMRLRANWEKRSELYNERDRRYGPGAPSRLPKGFGPLKSNPYDEDGNYYLTPERMAESEREFGEQFFTAHGMFGTTIQSARSRVKKWSAEVAAGDGTHAKDLTYYLHAIEHYERLKRGGRKYVGPSGKGRKSNPYGEPTFRKGRRMWTGQMSGMYGSKAEAVEAARQFATEIMAPDGRPRGYVTIWTTGGGKKETFEVEMETGKRGSHAA